MERIYKKVIGAVLLIALMGACKKNEAAGNDRAASKDTVEAADAATNKQEQDITKMSLNDLINNYEKEESLRSAYRQEIINRHEICRELYENYHRAFWGTGTSYFLPLDKNNLLGNANDQQYMQFMFSKKKVANDFIYDAVDRHAFNSYVSCFPVILIRDLVNNPKFKKLSVTKGYQNIPATVPPGLYEGDYYIAMLIYEDTDGKTRYFDIVSDPTRMGAEPARNCP